MTRSLMSFIATIAVLEILGAHHCQARTVGRPAEILGFASRVKKLLRFRRTIQRRGPDLPFHHKRGGFAVGCDGWGVARAEHARLPAGQGDSENALLNARGVVAGVGGLAAAI